MESRRLAREYHVNGVDEPAMQVYARHEQHGRQRGRRFLLKQSTRLARVEATLDQPKQGLRTMEVRTPSSALPQRNDVMIAATDDVTAAADANIAEVPTCSMLRGPMHPA